MAEVGNIKFGADVTELNEAKRALEGVRTAGKGTALSANEVIAAMERQSAAAAKLAVEEKKLADASAKAEAVARKRKALTDSLTISEKQHANALNGLSAQISDVVVSLQGGQAPLTVLLQQGAQIKDQFGGIGNVLRTGAHYLNPWILGIGAVGAGLYTAYQAASLTSSELKAFNALLKESGQITATGGEKLQSMAQNVQALGISYTDGKNAINEMLKAGNDVGPMFEEQARAIANAVDSGFLLESQQERIAKVFDKIQNDPAAGMKEYQKTIGDIDVKTQALILTLLQQGKTVDAQRILNERAIASLDEGSEKARESLGTISMMITEVMDAARGMWAALAGNEAGQDASGKLAGINKELENLRKGNATATGGDPYGGSWKNDNKARIETLEAQRRLLTRVVEAEAQQADFAARTTAAEKKKSEWLADSFKYAEKGKSNEQQRAEFQKQQNQLMKEGVITQQQYNAAVEGFNKAHKDPKAPAAKKAPGIGRATTQEYDVDANIYAMKAQIDFARQWTPLSEKMTREQNAYNLMLGRNLEIQKDVSAGRITSAQAEKVLATDRSLASAKELASLSVTLQQIERINKANERAAKFTEQQNAIRERFTDRVLSMGKREQDLEVAKQRIWEDQTLTLEARNKMLEEAQKTYDVQTSAHNDMISGFESGMADYFDATSNYMQQTHDVTVRAFEGMTDGIVNFVTTGKANMKSFVTSILGDLARIAMNKSIATLFSYGMSFFAPNATQAGPPQANGSFDTGGFTGMGGNLEPAGVVHRNEFVMDAESTKRIGVGTLYAMQRGAKGYASGGLVGGGSMSGYAPGGDINVGVQVNMPQGQARSDDRNNAITAAIKQTIDISVQQALAVALKPGGAIFNAQNGR